MTFEPFPISEKLSPIVAKVTAGTRISRQEALTLYQEADLALLGLLATQIKTRKSGRNVFYNKNFHIEPTNICVFNCRFCSYRRPADSPEAWNYSLNEIAEIAAKYRGKGCTEVHIVGGVHPAHNLSDYIEMITRVRTVLPGIVVKAFTAIELHYMITKAGLSLEAGLRLLRDAGMEAIPGGGAEIFAPEIRNRICPEKGTANEWLALHAAAHKLGITTNATILYGHIETITHRLDHLNRLRDLQDQTGGFSAFIPLKYRSRNNSLSELGEVSILEDMKTLAISRIFLDNFDHIKAYWPMFGKNTTEMALCFGADDIDGTIDDTTKIYSMAGAEDSEPKMTSVEMQQIIKNAGFIPVERDTFYNVILPERQPK